MSLVGDALDQVRTRVGNLVARAVVTLAAAGARQRLQVLAREGEVEPDVEQLQEYGFASRPLPGAEAVIVWLAPSLGLIVATDDERYRPADLAAGEAAMYDHLGAQVRLTPTGVELRQGPGNVRLGTGATLGVARLGDAIAGDAATATWMGEVTVAVNALTPGAVTPLANVAGTITAASATVKAVG